MSLPEVEFVMAWQNYRVGDRIRPNGVFRDWLVARRFVKVVAEPATVEVAVLPEPETAALRTERPKRKRGRPRKVDKLAEYRADSD